MPYQNDLQTLANIVSPVDAAVQAGIQNQQGNEELALKNQLSANQLPAESEKPGLMNLFTKAQTDTQNGIAQQQQAKGAVDQALVPSDINLGLAKNEQGTSAAKIQQYQQVGQIMNQAATFLDQVPEAMRPAYMQQMTQKLGVDPSTMGNLMNGNPDDLRNAATKIIQGSADYVTKMNMTGLENVGKQNVAETQSEGRVTASENAANARITAAQIAAKVRETVTNMNQQFSQIVARIGTPQEQPGDRGRAQTLKDTMQAVAQLGPQITQGLVGQQQLPIDFSGIGGGAPAPTPNAAPATQPTSSAPPGNALADEMRRRGFLK